MKIKSGVLLLVVVVGASLIWWAQQSSKNEISNLFQAEVTEPQRNPAAVPFQSPDLVETSKKPVLPTVEENSVQPPVAVAPGALPQPEVLQQFKVIQSKIFKSDEEQRSLKQMMMNSRYIQQLGEYLRDIQSVNKEEFKANQNVAIDFLIEALHSGEAGSAEQAILDVIKDSQVEDEKIPMNARELLGGVKADLLYQASSIRPALAEQFSRLLPGPVSQKIWENVQRQQEENLALSEKELHERQNKKSH